MFTICDAPDVAHPGFPCRHTASDPQVIAAHLAENPNLRDDILREMLGADLRTIRAALRLSDDFTRDAWNDVHRSSLSLSGRVSQFREARLNDAERAL